MSGRWAAGTFPATIAASTDAGVVREDWIGTDVDATKWTVAPGDTGSGAGAGMTVAVAGSVLTINSGTNALAETRVTGKVGLRLPLRAQFIAQVSQRIANCDVVLEMVNAAGDTRASWRLTGTSATAVAVESAQAGTQATGSTSVTLGNSAAMTTFEVDAREDGVDWNERTPEGSAAPSVRATRQRTTLIPGELYFPRIRVINGATAPASSTAVAVELVLVQAQTKSVVEIAGGRGLQNAGDSVPVILNGGTVTTSTASTTALRPIMSQTDETSTALAASGTYTGATRDLGTDTNSRPTRVRWTCQATAAVLGGVAHLFLDESTDGTTWRPTQQTPLPTDGAAHTGEWSIGHLRYYRFRVVNGATAMTALFLSQILVRGDGSTADTRANLPFSLVALTVAQLVANVTLTGPTLDLGVNHQWDRVRYQVSNTDATGSGSARIQVSQDASTWLPGSLTASGTNYAPALSELPLAGWRYVRWAYVQGGTAQASGVVYHSLSLVSL